MNRAIILAAGKGTRMKTDIPKCAVPILKKPMINYIIENVEKSSIEETVVVVGYKKEVFYDLLDGRVTFAVQEEQLGTGHAVKVARDQMKKDEGNTIILLGDMPLINFNIINQAFDFHEQEGFDITLLTTNFEDPKGYGRIIRDDMGLISEIVEDREATTAQKQINEVNTGIYVLKNSVLFDYLDEISNANKKREYYLTDIIQIAKSHDAKVGTFKIRNNKHVMGVNTMVSVSIAERYFRNQINEKHMLNGVYFVNPYTITIGEDVEIESNVTIEPNTTITGKSKIYAHAVVGPNTQIHNSTIHSHAVIKHSFVIDSEVGDYTTVGPFAHLRNQAHIGQYNRVGNFVEIKNSSIGDYTKTSHLTYIGDSEVGERVNFGCGTVTVNYDGVEKHKTIIGDDVFIGCNTNLVAPISVADNAFIAAGSTVTDDIPEGAFAIARNRQINKIDYAKNLIKAKKVKKDKKN
jgi:bifunctional UDP-N-acetylglucosamine pyrophosphorylase/glucosamine-1-phosphate N-acetyltransferase